MPLSTAHCKAGHVNAPATFAVLVLVHVGTEQGVGDPEGVGIAYFVGFLARACCSTSCRNFCISSGSRTGGSSWARSGRQRSCRGPVRIAWEGFLGPGGKGSGVCSKGHQQGGGYGVSSGLQIRCSVESGLPQAHGCHGLEVLALAAQAALHEAEVLTGAVAVGVDDVRHLLRLLELETVDLAPVVADGQNDVVRGVDAERQPAQAVAGGLFRGQGFHDRLQREGRPCPGGRVLSSPPCRP